MTAAEWLGCYLNPQSTQNFIRTVNNIWLVTITSMVAVHALVSNHKSMCFLNLQSIQSNNMKSYSRWDAKNNKEPEITITPGNITLMLTMNHQRRNESSCAYCRMPLRRTTGVCKVHVSAGVLGRWVRLYPGWCWGDGVEWMVGMAWLEWCGSVLQQSNKYNWLEDSNCGKSSTNHGFAIANVEYLKG